jgi:hypothetical protein
LFYNGLVCTQNDMSFIPSTKTTADLVVSLTTCGHQFHRLCIERVSPKPVLGVTRCTTCPVCREMGHIVQQPQIIYNSLWQAGHRPSCLCGVVHEQMLQYDTCPSRPAQCRRCYDICRFQDLQVDASGVSKHSANCTPITGKLCPNEGCGLDIHPGDKGAHLMSCPHRMVSCNTCRVNVKCCDFEQHCRQACKSRTKKCQFCVKLASLMPHIAMPTHAVKGECTVHSLLMEAVSNPQKMTVNIGKAEAESNATQNYSELEPEDVAANTVPVAEDPA